MDISVLDRDSLYREVWSKPLTHLAKEYGISNVGLKKICKKLNVPTPPIGYWQKLKAGKSVNKEKLPQKQIGESDTYELKPQSKNVMAELPLLIEQQIKKLTQNRIIVPKYSKFYHPLVKEAKLFLMNDTEDQNGILGGKYQPCLNIKTSKTNLNRALKIMNAIIIEFEKRNLGVKIENHNDTMVTIGNVSIKYRLRETLKTKKIPSAYNKDRFDTKLFPTGKLHLEILEYYYSEGIRKNFKDTDKKKVEDQISDFLINVLKLSVYIERERKKREEEIAKRKEKKQKLEEKLKLILDEEERINKLILDSENYYKSQMLRQYLNAVVDKSSIESKSEDEKYKFESWIKWATNIANWLDPLENTQLNITEEKEEVEKSLKSFWY